ncbi:hypothetical protein GW766_02145 [Candidatus Parcubacteria bacterium]|nr:hypothetical protein [Candidatus Parcubacteria bacterium]
MRVLSLVFIFLVLFAPYARAQVSSNDFTIQLAGGVLDTEAPTTPSLLSATPVAATQIDISWSAATDNVVVAGYSVLRDGIPIATTSLLTYFDTSLTASTTYAYAVRAFDSTFNYSSTSNSIATTTFNLPALTPVNTNQTQGTVAKVVIEDLLVTPGVATTSFAIATVHQARLELRWGRTASYELGYVMSDVYTKTHSMLLTELEPQTTYEYEIIGYTPQGTQTVLKRSTFTTLAINNATLPINVGRFSANEQGTDVVLRWENPPLLTIAHVRIVRSHFGFPEHPQDGAVVYQGLEKNAIDRNILQTYSPVYYTAFVYDRYGNVSSGAVAIVYASTGGTVVPGSATLPVATSTTPGVIIDVATSSIDGKRVTIDMKTPSLVDLELVQVGSVVTFAETDITLDASQSFTIRIPRSAVAGNLKSIIATVIDPLVQTPAHSYLLRINKNRTAYEAEIPALLVAGKGAVMVQIYDYEAFIVATYQTPVLFSTGETIVASEVLFPDILFTKWPLILFGTTAVLIFLTVLIFFLKRLRTEDKR